VPAPLFSAKRPFAPITNDSLAELHQKVCVVLLSTIGFLFVIGVILRFPNLGFLIERYNQF
jgi:hypothetical protein